MSREVMCWCCCGVLCDHTLVAEHEMIRHAVVLPYCDAILMRCVVVAI